MALSLSPYKGTRDFYPEDLRVRNYIFSVWQDTVERFGYEQYDASIIEPIELYQAKTSEEIVSEQTYSFTDRGGREVTLRPEMTPTVSRLVAARRQELAYPLRWYSIPNVWRYERPQRGRLREHWQLNIDVFGLEGIEADHEVISVADSIMQAFRAMRDQYVIKINSRELVTYILHDYLKLDQTEARTIIHLIDRMQKMDYAEFCALLSATISPSQREEEQADEKLLHILQAKSVTELPAEVQIIPAAQKILDMIVLLESDGVTNVEFDMTLMRGFMYYTDIVFEVFDTDPLNNRSLFGGGRYDGLVGQFGVEPVPTVGFGMGDVTIKDFLETHKLLPKLRGTVHATVVLVGEVYAAAQPIINALRAEGAHIAVDSTDKKLDKKLKSVAKSSVPYALIIGDGELADNQITIKDMNRGTQEKHSIERIITTIMADLDSKTLD